MKPGTLPVIRSTLQRIIQVVGGVSSVFPLFSQLVPPSDEEDTDDINRKVSVVLIDIISGLLTRSQANQEQMAEDKVFSSSSFSSFFFFLFHFNELLCLGNFGDILFT